MRNDTNTNKSQPVTQPQATRRPNESGRLEVMDHVKIFDPKTKEVILEKRA